MSFPAVLNALNCIFTNVIICLFVQIVKEKDRFRKAPPNYAMKKTQLLKEKVITFYIHCMHMFLMDVCMIINMLVCFTVEHYVFLC